MKLLIADDNPAMRSVIRNICGEMFSEIIECEDGLEAVNLYQREKPDWILMDIKMKNMDGIEATRIIRKNFPDVKVIIISQFRDKAFIETAIKAGAIKYLNKEELINIEEIIKENSNI